MGTLENVGSGEVELPQQEMQTTSAWLTLDPGLLAEISPRRDDLVDGLCDIRDVGAWLGDGSPSQAGQVVTRETMRAQSLPQRTSAASSRVERAGPGERHARPDRPRRQSAGGPADRPNQHECHLAAPARRRPPRPRADPIRTRRRRTRVGRGRAAAPSGRGRGARGSSG
jgi:hypothetical protein